jgi:hypothetical protein
MIYKIALTTFLGLPLVFYGGVLTLILILLTARLGYRHFKGISKTPFKWHPTLAVITILVAIIHGVLGLSIFLGY